MAERRVTAVPRPSYSRPPSRLPQSGRLNWQFIKRYGRLVLIGAAALWVWGWFGVKKIEVKGAKQISSANLTNLANQILKRHFWTNNLLTLNAGSVAAQMTLSEPRLKSVKLKRRWPSGLVVSVSEKEPALWWQTGQQNYLLDTDGSIIGLADGAKPLVTVIDSTNLPIKPGDRVVPASFVRFCHDLIRDLPTKTGINISSLKVPDTTSEVYATTNKGYLIKFDTTRPAGGQVDDLVNVLQSLGKKMPVEYIDLRIEHKAYYR